MKCLVHVAYKSWNGNECHKRAIVEAKSEDDAINSVIKRVQAYKRCMSIYWGDCVEHKTAHTN
jgi:hypothetical protein